MLVNKIILPQIPSNLVDRVYQSIDNGKDRAFVDGNEKYAIFQYSWFAANDAIQMWCRENISPDVYWGIQVIREDLPVHRDIDTKVKFNYLIESGGDNCMTNFYDDEQQLIESVNCSVHTWYILNVEQYHNVTDVKSRRISITGRLIP